MQQRCLGLLCLLALICGVIWAQAPAVDAEAAKALLRGQQVSEAISTITSTAISPLLGVCVLGVYEYFRTPEERRAALPMYTSPWFWIPVGILIALILFKDSIGGSAPLLKKPLDAVEVLMLNKASLILIGFPVVFHEVAKTLGFDSIRQLLFAFEPVVYAQDLLSTAHKAGEVSLALLMLAGGMMITFVVWLVGHAFDVLVLLSPFPFLDLVIKGMRTFVFAVLAALTVFEPRIGAIVSGFVILICLFLSGWAFRLMIFGSFFSWDLIRTLVFGWHRKPQDGDAISGFTARRIVDARKRTYGRVTKTSAGRMEFVYRPWLFGMKKSVMLDSAAGHEVGRGLFYPTLLEAKEDSKRVRTMIRFLPSYRKSEERLAEILSVKGVRDVRLGNGLRAFWDWAKDDTAETQSAEAAAQQ